MHQQRDGSKFHLTGAYFLSQILGCPSTSGRQKDADDDLKQHVDHSNALAAKDAIQHIPP